MSALTVSTRALSYWFTQYRRTWRGTFASSVISPVFFLAAMGIGLGTLVDAASGGVEGVSYLQFVAPGLLAATAMQTATMESTYPIMSAIRWSRCYHAMLATPLGIDDVLAGHLAYILLRVVTSAAVYLAVMGLFGALISPAAVLMLPVALLIGLAFAAPIAAFAALQDADSGFAALFRFVITPMFLFAGVFFPVSQLPVVLQWVAYVTPLWHGVALCRDLALGMTQPGSVALHVGYLLALAAVGIVLARTAYRRRLAR